VRSFVINLGLQVAALRVLQEMALIQHFQRLLIVNSGLATVVGLLSQPELSVRCLAAATLARAVQNHRSRLITRKAGAVPLLVLPSIHQVSFQPIPHYLILILIILAQY